MSYYIVINTWLDVSNMSFNCELVGIFKNQDEAEKVVKNHPHDRDILRILEVPAVPWFNPKYQNEE